MQKNSVPNSLSTSQDPNQAHEVEFDIYLE